MKCLIDAQLPRRLKYRLLENGIEAIHTLDLPAQNATGDLEIERLSEDQSLVVITKDSDYVNSFYLRAIPQKLLLISTGNIRNQALEDLFVQNLDKIISGFKEFDFIELSQTELTFHV